MGRRDNSPARTPAPLRLAGLDQESRDRIVNFLFPPHLGPDDVQHYANLRLVCREWRARVDEEIPFGRNTIPLLRHTTTRLQLTPTIQVTRTDWRFGMGMHHPTLPTSTYCDDWQIMQPLHVLWQKNISHYSYITYQPHTHILMGYYFWARELCALRVMRLAVIPEDDNEQ